MRSFYKKTRVAFIIIFVLFTACDTRNYLKIQTTNNELQAESQGKDSNLVDREYKIDKSKSDKDTSIVTHFAEFKTSQGQFIIGIFGEDAPETVANFIGLVKMKYYNGILFHRVAKDFLIQAGDRNTLFQLKKSEWGQGGESFYGGDIEDELDPNTPSYKKGYSKGTVAMANKGPNTNTSQFFICLDGASQLEHKWTIFGKVVEGMDVVEKISNVPVEPSERSPDDGIPVRPVRIYSVNIKLIHAPEIK